MKVGQVKTRATTQGLALHPGETSLGAKNVIETPFVPGEKPLAN
jgi:hypothetical protein